MVCSVANEYEVCRWPDRSQIGVIWVEVGRIGVEMLVIPRYAITACETDYYILVVL